MSKSNYKNYDDYNFDNGPEFENLDKNILDKIELSLAFIFTIFSLFLVAALFDYGGEIGNNLFELLTSSIGVFTYLIPPATLSFAYIFYYKKYKLLFHKISLLTVLFVFSIFLLFGVLDLSGDIGKNITLQISNMLGETFLILLTILTSFISFISILNMEKETLTFINKSFLKILHLIKLSLLKIFNFVKNAFSKLMNSRNNKISKNSTSSSLAIEQSISEKSEKREYKENFLKKIFSKIFSFKKNSKTIKVKHGDDLDEIELDEEEMEDEEFTKKYEIEKDENGDEYIIPKKNRNVHEELLEAASVKLSKEEREKIKVRKISKKEKEEELKINEYPEDKPRNKKVAETVAEENEKEYTEEKYEPAPLNLYEEDKGKPSAGDNKANAQTIKRTLQNFQISVEMDEVSVGPTVTRYTLKPAQGVKLSKIAGLDKNLAMDLSTTSIRIEAPIPGKSLVGIEIPNKVKATLGIGTLFGNPIMQEESHPLLVALGKDLHGKPVLAPLSKMPHLLIAGTTGSGKSSTIHALIHSLLYKNSPNNLKFIMIDPKKVELSLYSKLPHLFTPIIKEPKKAVQVLNWLINEMERRYEVLELVGKVNIAGYHNFVKDKNGRYKGNPLEKMPYIVVVIDELADFMMAYPKEMESCIVRLAQKSRAVGIHLVLSTQLTI
jgi:DNA segregation ATPase FtsK/SpoIIIE-like protein